MDYILQQINEHKNKLKILINNLINTQNIYEEINFNNEIKKESEFIFSLLNIKQNQLNNQINQMHQDFHLNLDIGKPMDDVARKKAREEYLQRQEAIRRQEEREKLLVTAYNAALDRYCFLDMLKTENAPTSPDCPVTMQYAYAVKRLDAAWYEVQKAEENLRLYEKGKEECTKN